MYNGIGLQTARGSGTNGYVQSNRFFVKPRLSKVVTDSSLKGFGSGEGTAGLSRKPNREILEHDRKRQIQLKLLVLEEKLTDQGYTDSEVAEKLQEARGNLEAEAAADALEDGELGPTSLNHSKISDTQTHQIAARKEKQMETLRAALGIGAESQNKRYAMIPSDSEDANNDDGPANSHKKDGKSKKSLKGVVDNASDLRNVKKSHGNESTEDTYNEPAYHKKQKQADISDSDDSEEKVIKKDKKKSRRKTTRSDSDSEDSEVKRKKKSSLKSRSRRRKHESDSSDSGSETDSGSDTDSGSETDSSSDSGSRKHRRSLKKVDPRKDKRDVKVATKKSRKPSISSDSDQSDYVEKKKISSKNSNRSRRHDSDSSSSESEHDRDSDGLDTLRKLEKLYQSKEEKMVKSDHASKELNRSKRKTDDGNWDEQPDRKSRRRDTSDLEYNDEVKNSLGSKVRSENRITDRWAAEPAREYDVARRESGEDRERQGRKHRRDEEEDTHRINDRDKEQQQPERNKREQDDRRSSRYDGDRDRDSGKRARYDDSRSSGRRYDEDDDRHGRIYSDGRHDDRRSRR